MVLVCVGVCVLVLVLVLVGCLCSFVFNWFCVLVGGLVFLFL